MNSTNAAVSAGVITLLGRWSEGDDMDVRIVVGVVILAFMLSAMPERLGRPFSYLIVAAVVFRYAPSIIQHTGITKSRPVPSQKVVPGHVFHRKGQHA